MIKIYNRQTKDYEIEAVAGERFLDWTYSSPIGMSLLELVVKKKFFSKLVGIYCDSALSKGKIKNFIKDFQVDTNILKKNPENFTSFNDFFIREILEEHRPITKVKHELISPCDGRALVYQNVSMKEIFEVKGYKYNLSELIGNVEVANRYDKGTCMIVRLCPLDYHRFHFIDDGICSENTFVKGDYYSVNPIAFNKIPDLFCRNKREWSIFQSENFGEVLHIEVGATCVGSIIQTYKANKPVEKGSEKGYFKFGGSTTILLFEKDKVSIDEDLVTQSRLGFETKISMGERIGTSII